MKTIKKVFLALILSASFPYAAFANDLSIACLGPEGTILLHNFELERCMYGSFLECNSTGLPLDEIGFDRLAVNVALQRTVGFGAVVSIVVSDRASGSVEGAAHAPKSNSNKFSVGLDHTSEEGRLTCFLSPIM